METIVRWSEPPSRCDYSPDHTCQREYVCVAALDADEYMAYLLAGWRRFGYMLFRNRCSGQNACRSLRVDVARFRPDRSQRRAERRTRGWSSSASARRRLHGKSSLYLIGFMRSVPKKRAGHRAIRDDAVDYARTFVLNPFPTQEWCYFLDGTLVGVGYVDVLARGLSAIYFAHDPRFHDRSLGTWNVLSALERASDVGLPHVYLGYAAEGCPSLQYKLRFRPNQVLDSSGRWLDAGS